MQEVPTWTFARSGHRLALQRHDSADGVLLTVCEDGTTTRTVFFPDLAALVTFQTDMETMLLRTGWHFESFTPERRHSRDRRKWPRISTDRRRWWTDGRT